MADAKKCDFCGKFDLAENFKRIGEIDNNDLIKSILDVCGKCMPKKEISAPAPVEVMRRAEKCGKVRKRIVNTGVFPTSKAKGGRPPKYELEDVKRIMLKEKSDKAFGKEFNISENTVRNLRKSFKKRYPALPYHEDRINKKLLTKEPKNVNKEKTSNVNVKKLIKRGRSIKWGDKVKEFCEENYKGMTNAELAKGIHQTFGFKCTETLVSVYLSKWRLLRPKKKKKSEKYDKSDKSDGIDEKASIEVTIDSSPKPSIGNRFQGVSPVEKERNNYMNKVKEELADKPSDIKCVFCQEQVNDPKKDLCNRCLLDQEKLAIEKFQEAMQ